MQTPARSESDPLTHRASTTTPAFAHAITGKPYSQHSKIHPEWQFGDWASDPGTTDIGGMLNHIFASINNHFGTYKGRKG